MTTARPSRDFRWTCRRKPWPQVEELPRPHKGPKPYKGDEAIHYSDRLNSTYQQRQFTRVVMDKHHKLIREAVTRMHERRTCRSTSTGSWTTTTNSGRSAILPRHVPRTMKTGMSAIALHGWQAGLQAHYERKAQAVPTLNPWIDKHLQFKRDYCNKRRARAKAVDKPPPKPPRIKKKSVDQLHAEIMAGWEAAWGRAGAPRPVAAPPRPGAAPADVGAGAAARRARGRARRGGRSRDRRRRPRRAMRARAPPRSSTPVARRNRGRALGRNVKYPGEAPSAPATSTKGAKASPPRRRFATNNDGFSRLAVSETRRRRPS